MSAQTRTTTLRARDLLTRDVATVAGHDAMSDATALLHHLGVRHLPVLDDDGLVGLLHEPVRTVAVREGTVLDHVVRDVPEAHLQDDLAQLSALLRQSTCDAVVVLDDDRHLLGVLTSADLARAVAG